MLDAGTAICDAGHHNQASFTLHLQQRDITDAYLERNGIRIDNIDARRAACSTRRQWIGRVGWHDHVVHLGLIRQEWHRNREHRVAACRDAAERLRRSERDTRILQVTRNREPHKPRIAIEAVAQIDTSTRAQCRGGKVGRDRENNHAEYHRDQQFDQREAATSDVILAGVRPPTRGAHQRIGVMVPPR